MIRFRSLVVLVGTLAVTLSVPAGYSEEKTDAKVKPLLTMYGRNSKIVKRKLLRITNAEDWLALWIEHKTGSPKPADVPRDLEYIELDFEKVMVVAVFEGIGAYCAGYTSDSISEVEDQILVRVRAHTYQSEYTTSDTQAWGILVIPRSTKEVVLERDLNHLVGAPSKWKEWKRFPAFPDKNR